jgi:hypothetical protein
LLHVVSIFPHAEFAECTHTGSFLPVYIKIIALSDTLNVIYNRNREVGDMHNTQARISDRDTKQKLISILMQYTVLDFCLPHKH